MADPNDLGAVQPDEARGTEPSQGDGVLMHDFIYPLYVNIFQERTQIPYTPWSENFSFKTWSLRTAASP